MIKQKITMSRASLVHNPVSYRFILVLCEHHEHVENIENKPPKKPLVMVEKK